MGGFGEIGKFSNEVGTCRIEQFFEIGFCIFEPLQDCFHRSMGLSHFLGTRLKDPLRWLIST